jgi:peptidoglycan DL-endopeptidase CwlO
VTASVLVGVLILAGVWLSGGTASAASSVLRMGSRGSAVVTLQRDLGLPADGVFGRQTRAAVVAFQRRHHLTADGIVGARTWQALGGGAPVVARPRGAALSLQAIYLAAAQRGKPYVWGAAGPNAFDCSGLMQWVFGRLGVQIPRTTYTQYAALRHVSHAQVQPGDLIFLDRLGHVGIYAGFGSIWHAPHTGSTVTLSRVWDPNYVAARVG